MTPNTLPPTDEVAELKRLGRIAQRAADVWETDCLTGGPVDRFYDTFNATTVLKLIERALRAPARPAPTAFAINALADRFLGWPVPAAENADACASMPGYRHQRYGTNFISAAGARDMMAYVLKDALTPAPTDVELDELEKVARSYIAHRAEFSALPEAERRAPGVPAFWADARTMGDMLTPEFVLKLIAALRAPAVPREVEAMREALTLAEDVLSRFPYSSEMWPNGTHPNTGIEKIRAALGVLPADAPTGMERWRPEIVAFADLMEAKLRENDHKGGWSECEVEWLHSRLRQETDELKLAAEIGDRGNPAGWRPRLAVRTAIGREAADVANFAMMIADVSGALAALRASPTLAGGIDNIQECRAVSGIVPDGQSTAADDANSGTVNVSGAVRSSLGAVVEIPLDVAKLVERVFLPANPNKMRSAHPDVVAAAKAFKSAVAEALVPEAGVQS